MKTKHAISLFIIGICFDFIGAFLKITHQPYADMIFLAGTFLKVLGAVLFLYKLSSYPKFKEFLNW